MGGGRRYRAHAAVLFPTAAAKSATTSRCLMIADEGDHRFGRTGKWFALAIGEASSRTWFSFATGVMTMAVICRWRRHRSKRVHEALERSTWSASADRKSCMRRYYSGKKAVQCGEGVGGGAMRDHHETEGLGERAAGR